MNNSVLNQSWIRREATIVSSKDPTHIGKSGILDETRETITLLEGEKQVILRRVQSNSNWVTVMLPSSVR